MVRVPTPEEEDAKRMHRERKRLVKERTAHVNRIRALLATQGIYHYWPQKAGARERLEVLRTHKGEALPPRLLAMLRRETDRLELVQRQIKEVEAARDAVFHVQPVVGETPCKIQALAKLRGIGPEFATVLATEVFYRRFENRRQLAAFVGLTPSPYMSGDRRRDQGISKVGSPMVRATMRNRVVWHAGSPNESASRRAACDGSPSSHSPVSSWWRYGAMLRQDLSPKAPPSRSPEIGEGPISNDIRPRRSRAGA
jgi:transposase